MSDIDSIKELLAECQVHVGHIEPWLPAIDDLVARNQNPGCGGDRQMSVEQWTAAKDCLLSLQRLVMVFERGYQDLVHARTGPIMGQFESASLTTTTVIFDKFVDGEE